MDNNRWLGYDGIYIIEFDKNSKFDVSTRIDDSDPLYGHLVSRLQAARAELRKAEHEQ